MAADSSNERSPLRRRFPVLRFLEISALALSPASVLIACLSLILMDFTGGMMIRAEGPVGNATILVQDESATAASVILVAREASSAFSLFISPWTSVVLPSINAVRSDRGQIVQLLELVRACVALMIWALAGLILCRRAAFLFAENDRYSLQNAINYSTKRWSTTLLAPAIPLSAALGIGLLLIVYGFVGRIPYLGSVWLVTFSPLSITAGLMIATFLIATALGWPLMVAAIATDDCDGFGGLSRAYSGITGRPWPFAGYIAFSLFVGSVLALIVAVVGKAAIASTLAFTSLGAGVSHTEQALLPIVVQIVTLIQRAIGVSFFWTAATVIYLFLRHEVDGLPLDHIASADDPAPVRDPLPVVGIPATDSNLRSTVPTEAAPPVETETV